MFTYKDHGPIQGIFNSLDNDIKGYQAYLEKAKERKENYVQQVERLRLNLLSKLEVVEDQCDIMTYETPNKRQKTDI